MGYHNRFSELVPPGVTIVRWTVGGLLLASALVKATSPGDAAVLATAYGVPTWINFVVVQFEVLLAFLLLSGLALRLVLVVTMATFLSFAGFSLYRALAGFESCGCFGAIHVHPWVTFVLDVIVVAVVGSCIFVRPGGAARRSWNWNYQHATARKSQGYARSGGLLDATTDARGNTAGGASSATRIVSSGTRHARRSHSAWLPAAATCFAIGGALWVSMWITQPAELSARANVLGNERLVILEPESWIGKPFPLADQISPQVDISQGNWTVLMYHHDCLKCQEALPVYEALASETQLAGAHDRVLLIEVPPLGHSPMQHTQAVHARLSDRRQWFVHAPVELQLHGGIVSLVSQELPSAGRPGW